MCQYFCDGFSKLHQVSAAHIRTNKTNRRNLLLKIITPQAPLGNILYLIQYWNYYLLLATSLWKKLAIANTITTALRPGSVKWTPVLTPEIPFFTVPSKLFILNIYHIMYSMCTIQMASLKWFHSNSVHKFVVGVAKYRKLFKKNLNQFLTNFWPIFRIVI